jgi:integrase
MASIRKRIWTTSIGIVQTKWQVDYRDNSGNRRRKQFNLKKDADAFRIKVEGQLSSGTHRPESDKVTVKEVCKIFLSHCQGRMERNERMTRKMFVVYQGHVNNHILHPEHGVGHSTLMQFTTKSVGEFRDALRSSGVTVPTARKILSTLHGILEHAVSQELIAVNAAHGVRVIAPRGEGSRRIKPPSKAYMRAILDAADDGLRFMVLFAASTGLRAGEQWAIRWQNVDTIAGMLNVERRVDAYGEEGPPKSDAGVRDVPLSEMMLRSLKEWRLKSNFSDANDLIFPNKKGRFMCHDNMIKRRYRPTLKAAEVFDINWHSLRHFAVSTWIEAGLTPKTIQTFAGHSSLQVTMDRYGHLFPSDDHKAAMDAIAGELMGRTFKKL